MLFSKNLHNLLQVEISGPDDDFTRYCCFELNNWPDHGLINDGSISSEVQYINIFAERLPVYDGEIFALGKGIFYNKKNDVILFSLHGDTSLYRHDDIYMAITNVFYSHPNTINVRVDHAKVTSRQPGSTLRTLYRRLIRLDPRTSLQQSAESFFSQTIEPLLYRGFLNANWVLLHAASLEKNGNVVLIFGPQNIGKTTLSLQMARQGWNMLGDDMCLLNSSGQILSHPKPLKIENEHLRSNKELYTHIRLGDSTLEKWFTPAYREIVKRKGKFEFKVAPDSLGVSISHSGQLKKCIFLERLFQSDKRQPTSILIDDSNAVRLTEQHIAAEIDVNKRVDRDIRYMMALHDKTPVELSLLTPKARRIIKSAITGVESHMLSMEVPNEAAQGLAMKLMKEQNFAADNGDTHNCSKKGYI